MYIRISNGAWLHLEVLINTEEDCLRIMVDYHYVIDVNQKVQGPSKSSLCRVR